ncbi:putative Cobalt-zinc-cadmium resistance protein CzcC [Candidatus Filomicrobium marinum]|uniref:Putative Cobalt-zinc-cadmium resistance protein CzcC n=1 Tax=Candidatus Filomicrobium marinum TaxID=1608628 RepID=A0A0D6JEX1_9HYPH|nr:TolC family protein [Candidatus Filomicrobium marinum]CFX23616.1 putative Cobalt-zinc-cadmium resistance protein CzcC [Candidatus Filomicrobium marinum]CPR19070.1 putative Cobalt-zinc-cadmium resistance protein CzcC [Candidatus Filomicrobium marinum]
MQSRLLPTHILVCAALSSVAGCSKPEIKSNTTAQVAGAVYHAPPPREVLVAPHPASTPPYDDVLTLKEAIHRALRFSPALQSASLEIEAKLGEAAQAAVRPNPELALDLENFGGTGDVRGFQSAESTLSLSQLVELGDKRFKRLAVADLDRAVAVWEFEGARLQVIRETAEAFIDVLAIQETIEQTNEANRIAKELERDVKARVDAGEASPVEIQRTRPIVANTLVRLKAERARLDPTKRRLASMWGQSRADFGRVTGRFSDVDQFVSLDTLLSDLERNPEVARWSDEVARRNAIVELEVAKSIPDLTLGAGVRRLGESENTAIVASASVPLPIFDRNAGNIAAAESRLLKADYERSTSLEALRRAVLSAYADLTSAAAEVRTLSKDVVPPAREAYRAVQSSFKAGASQLLEVLDARRVLFEAELSLIRAQADFEKAKVRIEGLVGRKI